MRDIKFRAWDYFNDVMIYDSDDETDFKFCNGSRIIKYVTEQHTVEDGIDIDRPVWNQVDGPVMQFTGLVDKGGKEIWEGDLCKVAHNGLCEIFWDEKRARFGVKWLDKTFKSIRGEVEMIFNNHEIVFEVIGNIFENPELLK